jgi:transposase-like protein/transposase Tn5 family protein
MVSTDNAADAWFNQELADCKLTDARLHKRLHTVLAQIGNNPGQSIPLACQDWANTKAAYRFFANDRVSEADILSGHFRATQARMSAYDGLILMLHDTTEFTYKRDKPGEIGFTTSINSGRDKTGRLRSHTVCGILMHSSLAVTTEGLPLGLAAIKFWTRSKFKGTASLKRKINPTRVPIEQKESIRWLTNLRQATGLMDDPGRCVHVGDRESDIYELFCTAQDVGTHFLVRTCVDRLAGDGSHTIADEMEEVAVKGLHRIEVTDRDGHPSRAVLEIRYRSLHVLPPIGKQKRYPALKLTVIHATERGTPDNRQKIAWKLITDLPVRSRRDAIEKIEWYAMRWKIEVFHKILKSGCKAEEAKLRTAQRLTNLLAVFCIVSWRVFWLTMLNRTSPDAAPGLVFTPLEVVLLDRVVRDKTPPLRKTLSDCLIKVARLGGYLARAHDPPPGNMVMWRGMARLTDITFGATIAAGLMGN